MLLFGKAKKRLILRNPRNDVIQILTVSIFHAIFITQLKVAIILVKCLTSTIC
uniref:Uncharacterized protein n=4 Tax=Cercopithecinae TaxID=9528 RepID=A0A2K5KHT7_CERAT|nr:unnamed protein product [Macaca fascicularis]